MNFLDGVTDVPQNQLVFTPDFSADELSGRRKAVAQSIGQGAHLVMAGAPPMPNGDVIQDANFYYLTGIDVPHSYLIVEGGSGRSTLFLPSRDTMAAEPENRVGFEDASLVIERTGVDAVKSSAELTSSLGAVKAAFTLFSEIEAAGASRFGANGCAKRREEEEWDKAEPRHKRFIRLLKERFPAMGIEDAIPLISKMRVIKSAAEIEVLRKAGALSAMAVIEAMKATRPGVSENDLQSLAEYIFRIKGRAGTSYHSIVAGGQRTWDGHYHLNSMTLKKDEVVLMDCAPDFRHYTSDIGRVWPVNGKFSPWHRMVCGFIREYHETLLGMVRPGALLPDIYREADSRMRALCSSPEAPYAGMKELFEQMIAKGIGYFNHAVGMSAHDATGPWGGKEPLREGMVFVCDPMVWCHEQHQYLRVEDTVVVTPKGCERLTAAAPTDLDEIEALVGSGRSSLPFFGGRS